MCNVCQKSTKSLVVIIMTKIGLEEPNENYLNVLNILFESEFFMGILGILIKDNEFLFIFLN